MKKKTFKDSNRSNSKMKMRIDFRFRVTKSVIYSGIFAIRHLRFPTSCDIRQNIMVPK